MRHTCDGRVQDAIRRLRPVLTFVRPQDVGFSDEYFDVVAGIGWMCTLDRRGGCARIRCEDESLGYEEVYEPT